MSIAGVSFGTKYTQEITCPAGAYSEPTKVPTIIAYNGRKDCMCTIGSPISCLFQDGPASIVTYPGGAGSAIVLNVNSPLLVITGEGPIMTTSRTHVASCLCSGLTQT